MDHSGVIVRVREKAGPAVLAAHLGITSQAISQWDHVPVKHVLKVSELTGIPPHEIRPDIYPQPNGNERAA